MLGLLLEKEISEGLIWLGSPSEEFLMTRSSTNDQQS
jgi:hypothetical protein